MKASIRQALEAGGLKPVPKSDWLSMPLEQAISQLGDLKRQYDRAAAIVMERQQTVPKKLTCWVSLHRDDGYDGKPIPASIVKQCRKHFPDGKWVFRDDGNYIEKDGIRFREPVVCCSPLCTQLYQRFRNDKTARSKGALTATEAGVELRTS